MNFLRPLFLEIEGRNLAKNFAKFSPRFSPMSAKKIHHNFALGAFRPNKSLHGQTIKDPQLDVQEINGVQEFLSQGRSRHRKCLFYSVLVP